MFVEIYNLAANGGCLQPEFFLLHIVPTLLEQVRLNYKRQKLDLSAYVSVGSFSLVDATASHDAMVLPCCPGVEFDTVTYSLRMHRRPGFYVINYIFPSALINTIGK